MTMSPHRGPLLPKPDRFANTGKMPAPEEHAALVVVGAGEAGCAAALEAARNGLSVVLLDEHPIAPGLIGMDVPFHFGGRASAAVQTPDRLVEQVLASRPALAEALEAGVDVRLSTSVWGAWSNGPGLRALATPVLGLADSKRSWMLGFDRLIIATGARDLTLSFAGSDGPGVMGAQALHTLLGYGAFTGRRLVVLGSGAWALRTALDGLDRGLDVAALVEVRRQPQGPDDLVAAVRARGIEIVTSYAPLSTRTAAGELTGLSITPVVGGPSRDLVCDTVCLALGAVPVIELFDVLGAERALAPERGGHVPVLGPDGATSVPGVWAVGDCAGLGGDPAAEGRSAARAVARSLGHEAGAAPTALRPAGPDALAYQMEWARALLDTGGTDVLACLCEEVTRAEVLGVQPPRYLGWRSNAMARRSLATLAEDGPVNQDQIKRLTRACMGPCQARRCREQVALLMAIGAGVDALAVPLAGYRAPVRPLPLSTLADGDENPELTANWNVWFGIGTQWIPYADIGTEREGEQLRSGMPY